MDYFIANSEWEANLYKQIFRTSSPKILKLGHPRNDVFFKKNIHSDICAKIKKKYRIPKEKKILLYAPTRNDERPPKAYGLDVTRILATCSEKWGGEWVCIARLTTKGAIWHYLPETPDIIFAHHHADFQELLVAADVCISDYSSCIFDYLHTRKPAFIFATDYASYMQKRGLYYPLSMTPFLIARNNTELAENIRKYDPIIYNNKVEQFLLGKGSIEDGFAAKRTVDFLENQIKG